MCYGENEFDISWIEYIGVLSRRVPQLYIIPMSNELYELEILTPTHFLVGGPLILPMEADISQEIPGSLRR